MYWTFIVSRKSDKFSEFPLILLSAASTVIYSFGVLFSTTVINYSLSTLNSDELYFVNLSKLHLSKFTTFPTTYKLTT